jgi:hypothetical protein
VLRETLLQIAGAGHFQPIWSGRIIAEVVRHQQAHGKMTADGARQWQARLAATFPGAGTTVDEALIARMTNEAGDRHVLAAAVAGGASLLVTANLKDFPPPALNPHGIEARHPAAFLSDLYGHDPAGIVAVLRHQAATWETPVPLTTLVAWLQTTAPRFARTVTGAITG